MMRFTSCFMPPGRNAIGRMRGLWTFKSADYAGLCDATEITIKTQWGEGWLMSAADKARVRAVMDSGDAYVAAVATGTIASMRF